MGYSMRFFGQKFRFQNFRAVTPAFKPGLALSLLALCVLPSAAQTAPYPLPYVITAYAGPHVAYTVGQACANGVGVALDSQGDGCLDSAVSVGIDPHDIRVDGKGNVYWEDNTSSTGVVHKISPYNQIESIYFGSSGTTRCTGADKYGNGCTSTDGAANSGPVAYTPQLKANRGLSVALNGDLLLAGYNLSLAQKVASYNDIVSIAFGTGTSGYADGPSVKAVTGTSLAAENSARGISEDANGNVYIADTGNNVIRVAYNGFGTIPPAYQYTGSNTSTVPVTPVAGQTYSITAINNATTPVKYAGSAVSATQATAIPGVAAPTGVPAISAFVNTPEDVQIDGFGNIFIADQGNNLVRVIYMAGTLPGIANPVVGYMYTIAGNSTFTLTSAVSGSGTIETVNGAPNTTYPSDGTTPTQPPSSVALSVRKIALDKFNNLYIADSGNQVVWFVDHLTGNIRLMAGSFGGARPPVSYPTVVAQQPSVAINCSAKTDAVGDGCPASVASITASADMGTSADNQGNLYITDAENAVVGSSLLRKVVSGLNFPNLVVNATTPNTVTQKVEMHLAPKDTPAATNPFVITATGTDFKLGAATCTVQADTTDDCVLPITFSPSVSGYDTAILTVSTTLGAASSFLLTGTGTAPTIAFDPGTISLAAATIANAQAIALDGAGNTYIADTANNRVLLTTAAGVTTTFAGTGTAGYTGDTGLATAARLNGPRGVAIDTSGSVFIADSGNNVIRKVDATGHITTYAGGATAVCSQASDTRGDGCAALQATFNAPTGLAADNLGQLFVADSGNNVIRQISTTTYVSTLAGGAATVCTTANGAVDTLGDGCAANTTVFLNPTGLAFDATGQNIFVADTGNNIVRKISLNNPITDKGTGTGTLATAIVNPVNLVAGNGQAGKSVDAGNVATLSQLSGPTGISVDGAGNVYIADTGNNSIRLVNANGGLISTIVGILGSSGTGNVTGSAVAAQLNAPAAVAVAPGGQLTILDSGNSRVLTDTRSTTTYNFGRTNVPTASPVQSFTELNVGTTITGAFTTPVFAASGDTTQFTLKPAANSNGTIPACSTKLAPGAICNVQGQFTPAVPGNYQAVYTENGTGASGPTPSITLIGVGAVLTPTTSTVAQTAPTGNSLFGGTLTLTGTVTPSFCNTAAPSCTPTGTISFVVDGTATAGVALGTNGTASQVQQSLSVGNHTVSCNYSGDNFYAASSCGNVVIVVAKATTTSTVAGTNNGKPQFTTVALTATVVSNTTGIPTGTVTFFANGVTLGTASLSGTAGTATFTLQRTLDANGNITFDNTLVPGTYSITCTYNGAANYATSNCAALSFIVAPQPVDFATVTRGCSVGALYIVGTSTPGEGVACNPGPESFNAGVPLVSVAQGSTTDAAIFIIPNNTLSGTLTFSCSGLPANSTCTFSPTSLTLVASTATALPIAVDMTLWTDLQPGLTSLTAPAIRAEKPGVSLAMMLGWPLTLLGLAGIFRFRRKAGALRGLSLLALLLTIAGSSMAFTGCGTGGPGAYQATLTPTGTYPITVTIKSSAGVTHTTVVYWTVTGPGIPGQE
jgi:sugar lactone lactonase YvrE